MQVFTLKQFEIVAEHELLTFIIFRSQLNGNNENNNKKKANETRMENGEWRMNNMQSSSCFSIER